MKKVLVIAYYFPPMGMGGVQRTAKFVRYLPEFGWEPTVLTVKPIHYYAHDKTLLDEVADRRIIRTDSMDPLRLQHLIKKMKRGSGSTESKSNNARPKMLDRLNFNLSPWLFIPDTKVPWVPWAIRHAKKLLKQEPFDLIFTTSPPHSVHLVGRQLKRQFNMPWVADFRDNWLAEAYEKLPTVFHRALNRQMATNCVKDADHVIAICEPIASYLQELSCKQSTGFTVLPNGYDRSDFESAESNDHSSKMIISYCGGLYPAGSPEPFFKGLALAMEKEPALSKNMKVQFVGSINGIPMQELLQQYGLENIVTLKGYVPHDENIHFLLSSDLLLLLISADSSPGIVTGKVFEYLASGKPVLGVVPEGEAAKLLREHQRGWVVHPDYAEKISEVLLEAFSLFLQGRLSLKVDRWQSIAHLERYEQTRQLADLFEKTIV